MQEQSNSVENQLASDPEVREFLWNVHKYTNEYIRFADTKAGFTAGAVTALIGGLVASSILDSCLRMSVCRWSILQWLCVLGVLLLSISLALCIGAIRPRLWNNTPAGYIFWGSIVGHGSAHQFTDKVHNLTETDRSRMVSEHLFTLASIAKRKYEYVDLAIIVGVAGGVLAGVTLFLQHALR